MEPSTKALFSVCLRLSQFVCVCLVVFLCGIWSFSLCPLSLYPHTLTQTLLLQYVFHASRLTSFHFSKWPSPFIYLSLLSWKLRPVRITLRRLSIHLFSAAYRTSMWRIMAPDIPHCSLFSLHQWRSKPKERRNHGKKSSVHPDQIPRPPWPIWASCSNQLRSCPNLIWFESMPKPLEHLPTSQSEIIQFGSGKSGPSVLFQSIYSKDKELSSVLNNVRWVVCVLWTSTCMPELNWYFHSGRTEMLNQF